MSGHMSSRKMRKIGKQKGKKISLRKISARGIGILLKKYRK